MKAQALHDAAVKGALDAVRARCDVVARRAADPVGFVHRFDDPNDRELVGLLAACIAFGNVKAVWAKLDDLLARLGARPSRAAEDPQALQLRLLGWKHRVFQGQDVARLLAGARVVQRAQGSLGARFQSELERADRIGTADSGALRIALAGLCDAIREAGGLVRGGGRRGPAHLLPDARGSSGSKRLLLFLRWMVRPADGIDLGQWSVPTSRLLVPVDVHIHKLSRNLGFTRRRALSWRTTEEITRALARFDASDPTKYDFSLCHLGMLQRCPSRADSVRCEGCGVKPVCIHWLKKSTRPPAKRAGKDTSSTPRARAGRKPPGSPPADETARPAQTGEERKRVR